MLHELRVGEPAALGETPFARYYGSVDATPLFLCLLGEYATGPGTSTCSASCASPRRPRSNGSTATRTSTATGSWSTSGARPTGS